MNIELRATDRLTGAKPLDGESTQLMVVEPLSAATATVSPPEPENSGAQESTTGFLPSRRT